MSTQPFPDPEDEPLAEGEPDPEWGLQMLMPGHPNTDASLEQPAALLEEYIPPQARPVWRTVPRGTRRIRKPRPDQPSPPESAPEPLHHCESNPPPAPTPPSIEPALLMLPDSPGLFGPRSPRSPHSPELAPEPSSPTDSWSAWQPNPALAPTPPPIEPALLVRAGSPGLFGPHSPRSSFHR